MTLDHKAVMGQSERARKHGNKPDPSLEARSNLSRYSITTLENAMVEAINCASDDRGSAESHAPVGNGELGKPAFTPDNAPVLKEPSGEPTQIRVHKRAEDGTVYEYVYGLQVVNVVEPWSTWLWRMARGGIVAMFSRLIWAGVGVLIYTHPTGYNVIQNLIALLPM